MTPMLFCEQLTKIFREIERSKLIDCGLIDTCSFDRFHNQARARGKDYIPVIGADNGEWTSPDYC